MTCSTRAETGRHRGIRAGPEKWDGIRENEEHDLSEWPGHDWAVISPQSRPLIGQAASILASDWLRDGVSLADRELPRWSGH